jgi:hypothetical protein
LYTVKYIKNIAQTLNNIGFYQVYNKYQCLYHNQILIKYVAVSLSKGFLKTRKYKKYKECTPILIKWVRNENLFYENIYNVKNYYTFLLFPSIRTYIFCFCVLYKHVITNAFNNIDKGIFKPHIK